MSDVVSVEADVEKLVAGPDMCFLTRSTSDVVKLMFRTSRDHVVWVCRAEQTCWNKSEQYDQAGQTCWKQNLQICRAEQTFRKAV